MNRNLYKKGAAGILPVPGNRRHDRCGATLMIGIVCLAMAAVLMGVVVRIARMQHGTARDETRSVQAAWLAESGLRRAAARLASDADYQGETWKIPAKVFGGQDAATVTIEVTTSDGEAKTKTISVRADFPDDPVHRVRKSKTLMMKEPPINTDKHK